jgi:hypothetical protein
VSVVEVVVSSPLDNASVSASCKSIRPDVPLKVWLVVTLTLCVTVVTVVAIGSGDGVPGG